MNIVVAILLFSMLVVIHELGHFIMAKTNGIGVLEFSIGMGPRIVTLVKTEKGIRGKLFVSSHEYSSRKEWENRTKYSLKLLPIGGSCMMLGEDEEVENENAFNKKSIYARMSAILGGPVFNFLFAFLLALILVGVGGYDPPAITSVEEGMPMSEAGFQVGDRITRMDGTRIFLNREISTFIHFNALTDQPITISYKRDGKAGKAQVTPKLVTDENGNEAYRLGFGYGSERIRTNALETIKYAALEIRYYVVTTVKSVGLLITGRIGKEELAGPVGIVNMVDEVIEETMPMGISVVLLTLINFSILLSANLGVMNLLPVPALDGGRMLFLIVEWIRGKPTNREMEGWINLAGFVALMLLMVFILYNDIMRIISGA